MTTNHRFEDDKRKQYLVYARLDLLYIRYFPERAVNVRKVELNHWAAKPLQV